MAKVFIPLNRAASAANPTTKDSPHASLGPGIPRDNLAHTELIKSNCLFRAYFATHSDTGQRHHLRAVRGVVGDGDSPGAFPLKRRKLEWEYGKLEHLSCS
jgi:hypothetical protein